MITLIKVNLKYVYSSNNISVVVATGPEIILSKQSMFY